jgi:RNA polymerase sigma-70 factor (ECF subfamily)
MPRLTEDRALLDGFRRGDRAALEEVYREYSPGLLNMLVTGFVFQSQGRRMRFKGLRDACARDNAIQEILARAFSLPTRNAYDGLRPFGNYLFFIARNYLLDLLREEERERPGIEAVPDESADASGGGGPADDLETREIAALCETFVAALEPRERGIFDLRFRQERSIHEVARHLRTSEHHVKRTEKVIKKRFFVLMKNHGYFDGYRLNRSGIEKVALLLVLLSRANG